MSTDDQNTARRDAEVLLRQASTNLAAIKLKLHVAAENFKSAAGMIRKALDSAALPAIQLPDRLLGTAELTALFEEWQTEANKIRSLRIELENFKP